MTECTLNKNTETEKKCECEKLTQNNGCICETENSVEIVAEVAGYKRDEIEISVIDNLLTIKCSRAARSSKERKLVHGEFTTADIQKEYALSEKIDTGSIKAELKDGLLRLRLGKKPEAQPRQITIN